MTLGNDLLAALPGLRAEAISRMTETVRGYVVTGTAVDPTTFENVETQDDVYVGVARIRYRLARVTEVQQATQSAAEQEPELHLPSGTLGIAKDTFFVITASSTDAALIGRVYRARGAGIAGQTTALRVPCQEVS